MAKEIEHKFLVDRNLIPDLTDVYHCTIYQGYLASGANTPTVRVRVQHWANGDTSSYLTVKGPRQGISCDEFEYAIDIADARAMLKMCGTVMTKTRYYLHDIIPEHVIELDMFHGPWQGLILAEVEVKSEDVKIIFPDWFTEDVSTDKRYANAYLIQNPL